MDTLSHLRSFFHRYPDFDDEPNREVVLAVNLQIDSMGAGPEGHLHCWRKFLHHEEGIDYFDARYGPIGALAARQHVLDDTGSVHHAIDYYNGTLDENGVTK